MKKHIFLIVVILVSVFNISAGTWKIHNIFTSAPTNLIDTDDKVYSLADGFLYCYEKDSEEFNVYNKGNYLHDAAIKQIYYNYEKEYLLVVYANSNVDIIQDNGKVINISDIKESSITASKSINDVTFAPDKAYLATDFGYVVINDKKFEILESRIFYKALTSVAQIGDVLFMGSADLVYYDDVKNGHNSLAGFKSKAIANARFYNIGDENKVVMILPSSLEMATISGSGETLDFSWQRMHSGSVSLIQKRKSTENYFAQVPSTPLIVEINSDGTYSKKNLPAGVKSELVSSYESNGHWWTASAKGVRNIEIKEDGTIVTLIDYMRSNASTITDPKHLAYNEHQKKLYVANTGLWWYNNTLHCKGYINTYDDNSAWEDITLPSVPTTRGNRPYLYSIFNTVFNPLDPDMYFIETYFEGVYVVKDGQVINKYDWTNSALADYVNYNCNVPNGVQFDRDNNLWIVQAYDAQTFHPVMLPADKITKTDMTAADWIVPNISFVPNWRQVFIISKKHNVAIYNSGTWAADFVVWDCANPTGQTKRVNYSSGKLADQDGVVVNWTYAYCFAEDKNGKVWVGHKDGLFELDPENIFSDNFRATKLKVPRGDGTDYADYLLDGIPVMCITCDAQNRKWIGTNGSGLFLVSADGSKVLEQFTTKNSILTSDVIYSVVCNPTTGAVYVGTPNGVLEYSGDGSTPTDDLSNVYVYPNPVRPEYTGMISITGLRENTLVKIANSSGTVVKSLMSNGGTATWDGLNESGVRVRSGVYYVLASKREGDSNQSAVAKFLIVR